MKSRNHNHNRHKVAIQEDQFWNDFVSSFDTVGKPSAVTAQQFFESFLILDAERKEQLNQYLKGLSIGQRKRLIQVITALDDDALPVELFYRSFLLVFPDQQGLDFYTSLLSSQTLSKQDVAHLIVFAKRYRLLFFSPLCFLFHLRGFIKAYYKLKRMLIIRKPKQTGGSNQSSVDNQSVELQPIVNQTVNNDRPNIGIVIHRAGVDFAGGAEYHSLVFAGYLSEIANVEIITTCARDYWTWRNELPEGRSVIGNIPVRRFRVDHERVKSLFQPVSNLLQSMLSLADRFKIFGVLVHWFSYLVSLFWMRLQGPHSSRLLNYLKDNHRQYDALLFFTYLYENTFQGLPKVADRSILIPTAHPEWPLRLPIWQRFFKKVPAIIYNTEEERRFLREWYTEAVDGPVIGCGIDTSENLRGKQLRPGPGANQFSKQFAKQFKIQRQFIVYTGRIDAMKGCRQLIAYFLAYLKITGRPIDLVMIGSPNMPVLRHDHIKVTGFIERDLLESALSECDVYVHPSEFESLSLSVLEAMAVGAPVLVNAKSDVLKGHVRRSKGGLWYTNVADFINKLNVLLDEPHRFTGGPSYVQSRYSHEAVKGSLQRFVLDQIDSRK